jgi:hypothetical protein
METTKREKEMLTYEVRVDLAEGFEIAKIEAATIEEALDRASKIWSAPQNVKLVGTIDRSPQVCLVW